MSCVIDMQRELSQEDGDNVLMSKVSLALPYILLVAILISCCVCGQLERDSSCFVFVIAVVFLSLHLFPPRQSVAFSTNAHLCHAESIHLPGMSMCFMQRGGGALYTHVINFSSLSYPFTVQGDTVQRQLRLLWHPLLWGECGLWVWLMAVHSNDN